MAARCHAFNPIHCILPQPPPCLLLLLWISGSDSERELVKRCSSLLVSLISLPSFSPGGDLDSPGLVLMRAAVSTVTDAGDKVWAPLLAVAIKGLLCPFFTQYLSFSLLFLILFSLILSSSLYFFTLQL